jgi:hypothetical protein
VTRVLYIHSCASSLMRRLPDAIFGERWTAVIDGYRVGFTIGMLSARNKAR